MTETRRVSIIRRVVQAADEDEIELLRFGVSYSDEDDVVALGLFHNTAVAERYLDETEVLALADGWRAVEMGLGDLVAVCAAFGIGYVAIPTGPGLAESYVGPVLEVVDKLAAARGWGVGNPTGPAAPGLSDRGYAGFLRRLLLSRVV